MVSIIVPPAVTPKTLAIELAAFLGLPVSSRGSQHAKYHVPAPRRQPQGQLMRLWQLPARALPVTLRPLGGETVPPRTPHRPWPSPVERATGRELCSLACVDVGEVPGN